MKQLISSREVASIGNRNRLSDCLRLLVAALLVTCMSSQAFAGDLSNATKASNKARTTLKKAIDSKDSGLLASLFTSDGAIITPNGYTVSGRIKIRMAAKMVMLTGETGALNTVRKSMSMVDGAAYETGSYTFVPTSAGAKRKNTVKGHYTLIWRLEDKSWKIHRAIGI